MQTLQTAGLVPDYFINPNANPWHGRIDVKESKNDSNKISVDLTNLSNNGCQSLQQKMLKYTSNNDASCVKQGGSTYQFTGTF
ncbi:MAG: hypothetical protein HWD59_02485 [Coxiellaceae bacterium]|nr:MAG: hypothetical protein HWD59_02485 [Coxiellaceae bacterium]